MQHQRLNNKVALITGAGKGIGRACAQLFAAHGAQVIVSDIDAEAGLAVAIAIQEDGGQARFVELDVAQESDWQRMEKDVLRHEKRLDVLVNNAGIIGFLETGGAQDPEHMELSSWHAVMAVNSDGVALGCKYGMRLMKNSRAASIVNMSSRSGLVGIPGAAPYAASKAAVRNHSKTVALYCAQQGYPIRCNSIHPGAILTPLWDAMLGEGKDREAAIAHISQDIPIGHMGEPLDVAYAALYLASDEAKYVTGIELTIDGGILAGSAAAPGK
ncbi:short-chain dehydrogenase [Bacterioplanes sanyensis]|uniref:Short-chain dehydrogenase n=1 Tax=Bacterioplanes sanyensis TaxID=1249553 RepID=A0A222FG71_9GAMM|nr:SDR family oxidoreductase [Bacterioplanes sanyensis]ASP37586.1 short-chain dehydrogenase [Bacterioplanes sanyensis]